MPNGNIFISYRRDDTSGHAGRLYDRLNPLFPGRVVMDVASIGLGDDFVDKIEAELGDCLVFIELIGKEWTTITDRDGRRRLFEPKDFVRLEVATALRRGITVIPVLVEGATMPDAATLPEEIAPLAHKNALELTESEFDYGVDRLVKRLEAIFGLPNAPTPPLPPAVRAETSHAGRLALMIGIGVVGLVVIGVIGLIVLLFAFGGGNNSNMNDAPGIANNAPVNGNEAESAKDTSDTNVPLHFTATASSVRLGVQSNTYYAANAMDGKRTTAWMEGAHDDGLGQWIRFDFDREVKVHRIHVLPGYFKSAEIWRENNRVAAATLYFSDGSSQDLSFTDQMESQEFDLDSVKTKFVRLVIKQVYKGSDPDTAISEVAFEWEP